MHVSSAGAGAIRPRPNSSFLIRAAVASALAGTTFTSFAAAPATAPAATSSEELQEVTVTGSRITRRDTESTSPLVTVDKEVLEKSSYISIEQALNELPQFMAGGALFGAGAVTGLTAAGDVAGGSGTGNMFDTARGVDNARAGQFTPGAATVNLRGLGTNRSLTLIDGRRAIPNDASGAIDLNTVPQIAIGNIEVISGGASSVYGADALAGVTNIKLRTNFEGAEVRARGGINQHGGDGQEWQFSTLLGGAIGDRGHAMVAMDYSKRLISLWKNRSYFREVMESPLSNAGDYIFQWYPGYAAGGAQAAAVTVGCPVGATCTSSLAVQAGGGSQNVFNRAWAGNGPSQAAINSVFADRTCGTALACVTNASQGTYYFNPDGSTLFTVSSNATVAGVVNRYGPQSFTGTLGGTEASPDEFTCGYVSGFVNQVAGYQPSCNPSQGRVDYGRRL
ncbi:MAG: TonB-dependent receptor plug domain-containing protein, partial [Steroidobacteraceae bacterium]